VFTCGIACLEIGEHLKPDEGKRVMNQVLLVGPTFPPVEAELPPVSWKVNSLSKSHYGIMQRKLTAMIELHLNWTG
jgi:hypothetical protein